jgi:biotin carboxyl carrier protein
VKVHTDPPVVVPEAPQEPVGESVGLGVRLVVAPAAGRLRHLPPAEFRDGHEWVSAGQPLALVEQGGVGLEVRSPVEGRVVGVLVRDGEPVHKGQPLVWVDEARPRAGAPRGP